jgi:mono/diheme cytochrome c family protein
MSNRPLTLAAVLVLSLSPPAGAQEDLLERGTYLVRGLVGCGNCHTPRRPDGSIDGERELAGTFLIDDPAFKSYAPNITMDEETGIGRWTDQQIIDAIRNGVRPDGTIIGPPMPSYYFYRGMSDRDVRAIVAYLRTVEPVRNVVPRTEFRIPLPPAWGPPVANVPDVAPTDAAYPEYLATTLAHCSDCHTPLVEGMHDFSRKGVGGTPFHDPWGLKLTTVSRNITPSVQYGVGSWTDAEIKAAITDGVRPDGTKLAPLMGFSYYENVSDEDLDALVRWMRELPPLPAP